MIDLSTIPLADAEPEVQDFGGLLTPPLGGAVQHVDRIGTRWTMKFETPNLAVEPDIRIWSSRLARGKREGVLLWVPEPDLPVRDYGAPRVAAAVAAGSIVALSGLPAGAVIVEGKWLSFIHDGRRYLHRAIADAVADGAGRVTIGINPMLRTSLAAGDVVELAVPKMQGSIPDRFGWPIPLSRFASLSIVVSEDE